MSAQFVAPTSTNHELIVDVYVPLRLDGKRHVSNSVPVEQYAVAIRVAPPRVRPSGKMRRLDPQNGGLQRIQSEISANGLVDVLRFHTVIPKQAHFSRERGVVG